MIFLDTSAIYALADHDDACHREAGERFEAARRSGEEFVLHNYILVESAALLERRLGKPVALLFLGEAERFRTIWVDPTLHARAMTEWKSRRGDVSLVDTVSFLVMRGQGVSRFLGFDEDFKREGFTPYAP